MRMTRKLIIAMLAAAPGVAGAFPYYYVDWTTANPAAGTASGTITLPNASTVSVNFSAVNPDGSAGSFFFANTNGGTDYWTPRNQNSPYISPQVDNPPPDSDILALVGGAGQIYRVALSEAIKDPIMGIVSLGQPGVPTTYDFDSPFTIVSQGAGFWGGGPNALAQLPGDVLRGNEGHGTIQFIGTFSNFSWTVPTPENWHGFTFGIRTTQAIEPGPSPVPEPGTVALLALALAGVGLARRRPRG